MTLIFRLIIRRDIWIFHSKVFSSDYKTKTKQKFSGFLVEFQDFIKIEKKKLGPIGLARQAKYIIDAITTLFTHRNIVSNQRRLWRRCRHCFKSCERNSQRHRSYLYIP